MKFLRSLPAAKFEMTMIGDRIIIEEMRVPLTPIIDGEILPKSISELRKEAPPIRAMAGVTKHEGLLFCKDVRDNVKQISIVSYFKWHWDSSERTPNF